MADDTVERLAILIEANTKSYSAAMTKMQKDTERAIRGSTKAVAGLNTSLASIGAAATKAAGVFGIAFGASALVSKIRESVRELGDLSDAAERAGVSAEKLQVLRFAMEQTTGSAEQADAALSKFNVTLGQAATTGKGADLFKALDVSIRDVNGAVRESSAVFDDVVKRFGQIKSPAQRAAVSVALFGKNAGPDMAALLQDGGKGIDGYDQKLRDLGGLMSNDMVKAGDELDNKFKQWAGTLDVIWKSTLIGASEAISSYIGQTQKLTTALQTFMSDPTIDSFVNFLAADPDIGKLTKLLESPTADNVVNPFAGSTAGAAITQVPKRSGGTIDLEDLDKTGDAAAKAAARNAEKLQRELDRQAEEYARQLEETVQLYYAAVDDISGRSFDAFDDIISGSAKAGDALKELLADLLKAEAKSLFMGAFNPTAAGGSLGTVLGGLFGGFRAGGGDVEAGKAYGVGEKGPELFVPRVPGRIVANGKAGGGGVTIVNNIDASGADMAAIKRLEGALIQSNKSIEQRSLAALSKYQTERS